MRANVELVLSELGILDAFDVIVAGEDVSVGKPAPDVFLVAARKLELSPDRCVVVEDAVPGVAAANAANIPVIAVTTSNPRYRLQHADLVVDSLEELTPSDFAKFLQ